MSVSKTKLLGVRMEPELRREFDEAAGVSDMTSVDALRLAAKAMIAARKIYGRIPKDMEIRQARLVEAGGGR